MDNKCNYSKFSAKTDEHILPDHPKLTALISHIKTEFSLYKFTVYRCASKLSIIQKVLFTSKVPYSLVLGMLDRHRLNRADHNLGVYPFQLTALLHDIFSACDKLGLFCESTAFDLETATVVLANFFWNVFDSDRVSPITQLEVKETFLLLCGPSSFDQVIHEYFQLGSDHNRCISRFRFEAILKVLGKIFSYIGEADSYGCHIIPSMLHQCFEQCPGINGINEYQFSCLWSNTNTNFLIYANLLGLINRINDTERLIHNVSCALCLSEKIIGIQFKCEICKKLSLCMRCFAIGYYTKKHDVNHRMYEVYYNDIPTTSKWTQVFSKLCNIFFWKTDEMKIEDTAIVDGSGFQTLESDTVITNITCKLETNDKTARDWSRINGSFRIVNKCFADKLLGIIDILNDEIEKISTKNECLKSPELQGMSGFLDDRTKVLSSVIKQLNLLMKSANHAYPVASTPNHYNKIADELLPIQTSKSINGPKIDKIYSKDNRSNYSDLRLHETKSSIIFKAEQIDTLSNVIENMAAETQMLCFRDLLWKVKEILDDSYSDNSELAEATHRLETVLDSIIAEEERKRRVY